MSLREKRSVARGAKIIGARTTMMSVPMRTQRVERGSTISAYIERVMPYARLGVCYEDRT
jgi:hypothetical protein